MANTATVGILRVLLTGNSAEFDKMMDSSARKAKAWSKDLGSIGKQATDVGRTLTAALTLPLAGIGIASAKAAIDFQSSFAGVRKTVDGTEQDFAELAATFRNMAKEIPVNVNELNRIGEAAGALGIKKQDIGEFTKVMAMLGMTTNVTANQAAESIAKIQNQFGAAGKDTENFASALVDLGNKGASTEQEILALATRISSAGNTVGLTQAQVLGFSAAIANVGMEAEAGGSAMSRVLLEMSKAVSVGGNELKDFARVAQMSSDTFAKLFKEDAAAATQAFVEGLGKIKREGGDLNKVLGELGFTELRQSDLLRRLAGASDMVGESLKTSQSAWKAHTALSEEASKRFDTTASKLTLLWNRIQDVAITLGNALLPTINNTIKMLDGLIPKLEAGAKWFADLDPKLQAAGIGFVALVAAAGPALILFGQMALGAKTIVDLFTAKGLATRALAGSFKVLTGSSSGLLAVLGPAALGAAVGGLMLAFDKLEQSTRDATQAVRDGNVTWGGVGAVLSNAISRGVNPFGAAWRDVTDAIKQAREQWAFWKGQPIDLPTPRMQNLQPFKTDIDRVDPKLVEGLAELDKGQKAVAKSAAAAETDLKALAKAEKEANAAADALNATNDKLIDTMRDAGIMTQQVVATGLAPLIEKLNLAASVSDTQLRRTLIEVEPEIRKMAEAMRFAGQDASWLIDWLEKLKQSAGSLPEVIGPSFENIGNLITTTFGDSTELVRQTMGQLPKIASDNIGAVGDAYRTLGITSTAELRRQADEAQAAYLRIKNSGTASAKDIAQAQERAAEAADKAAGRVTRAWDEMVTNIGRSLMAFADTSISFGERAANAVMSIFGSVATVIMGEVKKLSDYIGKSLTDLFSSTGFLGKLGGLLGGLVSGGIAAIAGWALNKIGDWIDGLINKPSMKANDLRDVEMTRIAGDFGGTGVSGTGAGSDFSIVAAKLFEATGSNALFERFLKADTPEKFAAALQAVNAALDAYKAKTDAAAAATEAQQAKVEEITTAHKARMDALKAEMQSLNDEVKKWDELEAPEEVMGTTERLAREKIAQQQATVQAAMDEQQRIAQEALDAIATGAAESGEEAGRGLGDGFQGGFDRLPPMVDGARSYMDDRLGNLKYDVGINFVPSEFPSIPNIPPVPGFARGSDGLRDFGTAGTLVRLHGREEVRTEAQVRASEMADGMGRPGGDTYIFQPGSIISQSLDPRQSSDLIAEGLDVAISARTSRAMKVVSSLRSAEQVARR